MTIMPTASLDHQHFISSSHFHTDSPALYDNRQYSSSSPSDYQGMSPHDDMLDGQFTADDFHDHNVSSLPLGFQHSGSADSGDTTSQWPDTPDHHSSWSLSRPPLLAHGSSESDNFVQYQSPYQSGFADISVHHGEMGNRRHSFQNTDYQFRDRQPQMVPGQAPVITPPTSDNSSSSVQPSDTPRTNTGHARRPKVPHTQAERRYRENLNMHLETLRKTLPNVQPSPGKYGGGSVVTTPTGEEVKVGMSPGAGWKPSKAEVIASAIGYIRLLENENRVLWSEVNALR